MKFNYKMNKLDAFYLFLSILLTNIIALVLPFSMLIIFDRVLPTQSTDSLYFIFAIVLASIIIGYFVQAQEDKLTSSIMKDFDYLLTNKIFNSICHAEVEKYRRIDFGSYVERISMIPGLKEFFGGDAIKATINLFNCFVTISVLFLINASAGICLIFSSLYILYLSHNLSNQRVDLHIKRSELEGATSSKNIEIISNPIMLKSRAAEYRFEQVMNQLINEREDYAVELERHEYSFSMILNIVQHLSIVVIVAICAISVINLDISQGVMAAVILLVNRYFAPYQQVMHTLSRLKLNKIHMEKINKILELSINNLETKEKQLTVNSIQLSGPNDYNFNFTKHKGFLLSGKSGTGKSQIIKTIALEQSQSDIKLLINKTSIENINYDLWKSYVAKIDRHSTLIEGTIIENLTSYRPNLNNAAFSLCENFGIKTTIDKLNGGFYTQIKNTTQLPFSKKVNFILLVIRILLCNKAVILIDDIDFFYDKHFGDSLKSYISNNREKIIFIIVSNKIKTDNFLTEIKVKV